MSATEFLTEKQTTKTLSFFLRHEIFRDENAPNHDEYGFVNINELIKYIKDHNGRDLKVDLIKKTIESDERNKFSIVDDKIRANFGHGKQVLDYFSNGESKEIPEKLYAVIKKSMQREIQNDGFMKSNRDKDFFYESEKIAMSGKEDRPNILVLTIDTKKLSKEEIGDFTSNKLDVWQTKNKINIDAISFGKLKNKATIKIPR